jgi:hypothetical protein
MTTRRLAPLLLAVFMLAAGCGRLTGAGHGAGGSNDAIEHPSGPNDLVVRWELVGGFVTPETTLGRIPAFSLYGDGRVITEGPQIEIYPGPALPNLLVQRISEDGVQAILRAARQAGLTDGNATYPNDCVADVPETRFTVVADGRTSVVTANALGVDPGGCPGSDRTAEERLSGFVSRLGDLARWLPEGSLGAEGPFSPEGLRVFVGDYRPDPELDQRPVRWPGSPLAGGKPVGSAPELRCEVVGPSDLAAVLKAASTANQLTPWVSAGTRYAIVFRPLLPDESGC